MSGFALADGPGGRTIPDLPTRVAPAAVGRGAPREPLPAFHDLDGMYLWLGPSATGSYADGRWDSTFGAALALVRVREAAPLAVLGVSTGIGKWTERDGGRIWADLVLGTRRLGPTVGLTLGGILELAELANPRPGGAVGLWLFTGVTPFVRAGLVTELGGFVELGLHIALPAWRWR